MFDRAQDWADVEAVYEAGTADPETVRGTLRGLLEPDDPRLERLDDVERRTGFRNG
jgi:hypothetical protein